MNIADLKALENESIKSKDMGFNGKAAIHPNQVEIIKKSFLPSEDELEEARDIIKAFKKSSSAVIAFRGRMVDLPIVLSMEKRLRLVGIDPKNID
jgi:citrate lyase subunit beta/citryl-CoA lyase